MSDPTASRKLSDASLSAFHEQRLQLDRALRHYDHHVDEVLRDERLSRDSRSFLQNLWYGPPQPGALSLASRDVREALTLAEMLSLLRLAEVDRTVAAGPTRVGMLSTCPSVGYSPYETGYIRPGRVKDHFGRCMRRRRLEGLACVDLALIHDAQRVSPTEIGIHFHSVSRPGPTGSLILSNEAASAPSTCKNKHGLPVARWDVRASALTHRNVVELSYYASKISCGLKQETSRATHTSQQLWLPIHALRALEIYSHFSLSSGLLAVGTFGAALKQDCEDRIARALNVDVRTHADVPHREIRRSWQRLYRDLQLLELRPIHLKAD